MALSAWMLAAALPMLIWCAVMRLAKSRSTAMITTTLFVLSGGLGTFYFFRDVRREGWQILRSLPQTYARIPDQHLWVDNTISASLYAQRSTLLGLSVGAAALILVLAARPRWSLAGLFAAGAMIGVLGIGHAHMLLTALALGGLAMLADRRRAWLAFLLPAAVIGLPLTWAISPETNSMRWMIGWMAPQSGQVWGWFWVRNVGLLFPLFAVLSLVGGGLPRLRRLTSPLWLWFVVPNLVAFHPSEWNNTKFFLFWQFGGSLLIASWLTRAWRGGGTRRIPQVAVRAAVAVCILAMVAAGGLDTVRAMQRSTAIPWVERDDLAAASWLRTHSRPDDVVVYGMTNYSAVAALSGRRVVSGYTGWTYDLGLPDWAARWSDSRLVLSGSPGVGEAIERYGVDFVAIGPSERREDAASDDYWSTHGDLVFEQGEYRLYRVAGP